MVGITKTFPGVTANDDIDFSVGKSEIHGLLGENGAGKSVLMSILYGLYRPDSGKILVNEEAADISGPSDAMSLGIGMVHQHFMLVPSLTVVENVILGTEPTVNGLTLDRERMLREVAESCRRYRLDVDVEAPVYQLPVGVQQRVEILKALYRGADVLILDEPTSVLTPGEAEDLFNAIRELKANGKTVIFISHKLREALAICDRITVLKRGKVVGTVLASETNERQLAEMMVGREIVYEFPKEAECGLEPILRLEGLACLSDRGIPALRGLDLDLCGSEILGVAGVEGNGQTELVEAVMGLRELTRGNIKIDGREITDTPPRARIRMGVSHIPEDRYKRAIVPDFSVLENLMLGSQRDRFTRNGVSIDFAEATRFTREVIRYYQVATPGPETLIKYLSGGNQQRVVVAREFSREPKIVIAAQPTRGLDVGATEYVRRKLVEMREQGAGVLLISADLDEIWALSDRVAVIYEGRIVAVKEIDETDQQEIGLLMAGGGNG